MNTVERAREIRKELKKEFPGVKFSVRSSRGGGSSINIYWTDFPTVEAVEEITNKYKSVRYDEYTGEILCGGNIFVFTNNHWSEDMKEAIKENIITRYGLNFYNEYVKESYDGFRYEKEAYKKLYEASKEVKETPEVEAAEEVTTDKKILFSNDELQVVEVEKTTRIYFNGKPGEEIRNNIKSLGFRFFKNDGFYWGNYSNKVNLEALKAALQIEEAEETTEEENNNSLSEVEVMEIIKNAEEYKNQILKEELEELKKEIQPLEFKEVEENNIIYLNDIEIARKPSDIKDIKEFSELENILIDKYAILSNEDFNFMCKNLMNDYNFISGLGGSKAIPKEGEEVPENYDIDYIYFIEINLISMK